MSNRYLLPLIDSQMQVVPFEVYGIDVITADIQSVSVNNVVHLFKDVTLEEIIVDVLIGYGYAGYHPVPEQKSGHLLLLRNRFGSCLGGTHAELKDANHAMQIPSCTT